VKTASCCGVTAFVCLSVLSGAAAAGERLGDPWHPDGDAAWRTARDGGRPLLLVFSSDRCYYCRKMMRDTLSDPQVVADIRRGYVATIVRAADRPQLVQLAGVRAFPTTILIGPDGRERDRIVGYRSPGQFRQRLSASAGP
jgi:thioredoxin-related protein